jgi:hypothetical protein
MSSDQVKVIKTSKNSKMPRQEARPRYYAKPSCINFSFVSQLILESINKFQHNAVKRPSRTIYSNTSYMLSAVIKQKD